MIQAIFNKQMNNLRLLLFISIATVSLKINAQVNLVGFLNDSKNEQLNDAMVMNDGIVFWGYTDVNKNGAGLWFVKTSLDGKPIWQKSVLKKDTSMIPMNLYKIGDIYYVWNMAWLSEDPGRPCFLLLKFDSLFNQIASSVIKLPFNFNFFFINLKIKYNSNDSVFYGNAAIYNTDMSYYEDCRNNFYFSTNKLYDSIKYYVYDSDDFANGYMVNNGFFGNDINLINDSIYVIYKNGEEFWPWSNGGTYLKQFNKHFDIIHESKLYVPPKFYDFQYDQYAPGGGEFNTIYMNKFFYSTQIVRYSAWNEKSCDSAYLAITKTSPNDSSLLKFRKLSGNIEAIGIDRSTNPRPGIVSSLDTLNGNFYICGTYNMDYIKEKRWPLDGFKPVIVIAKIDSGLNVVWEKKIQGLNYYTTSVKALPNGNCVVMGSFFDELRPENNYDAFAYIVLNNGVLASIDNELPKEENVPVIYPNPAKDKFNIRVKNDHIHSIEIYDLTGKLLYSKELITKLNETSISIEFFLPGLYYCLIKTNSGVFKSKLAVQ